LDALGNDPVWKKLGFSVAERNRYQYQYKGSADGKSFIATALGDVDCDAIPATYELRGTLEGGKPVVNMISPAPGVY